jgi:hypothetical protein
MPRGIVYGCLFGGIFWCLIIFGITMCHKIPKTEPREVEFPYICCLRLDESTEPLPAVTEQRSMVPTTGVRSPSR